MQNYRTNRTPVGTQFPEAPETLTQRSTHSIRKTLLEALSQVSRDQSISFSPIDAWVYMLAIPSTFRYTMDETRQIAKEIQHTILPPKKPRSLFSIVTWPEIANHLHRVQPTYKEWYQGTARPFEDGSQFVFFIDSEIVKKTIITAIKPLSFSMTQEDKNSAMYVSDGHMQIVIPTMELAQNSIWTARDLTHVIDEWIASLSATFRLSQLLLRALKVTFKDSRFRVENRRLFLDTPTGKSELNYQKMISSIQFSELTPAEWLKPFTLKDLVNFDLQTVISVRSDSFLRVRPGSAHQKADGYTFVAEKEFADRLVAIEAHDKNDESRFERLACEDRREISRRHFTGHSFSQDDSNTFAMALVGDQVASILHHPELVLGALLTSFGPMPTVRVVAVSEDIAVIAHPSAPWSAIEDIIRRAHTLLLRLSPDGSDPLFLDQRVKLPEHGCGHFSFTAIPAPYFDLMETAADESLALPPGRCHYLRGLAFELIREWSLAEHEFRRAFGADSTDGDIAHALGRALGEMGQHKEALQFLKKATIAVPEDAEIANTYGLALLKCNHIDLAAKSFERAVELAPDDPQFLSNLGQSYFMSQRIKDAEHILGRALEFAPSFSDAHSTLAQIRWRQGDIVGARKHARKAFASNPSNKGVQDLLWALTVDEHK